MVGYSPKGRKELDKTERLSSHRLDIFKVYSLVSFDTCTSVKCHHNQDAECTCHPQTIPGGLFISLLPPVLSL